MTINDTVKYVDAVDDMIDNYNNTKHSSIHRTPFEILKKEKLPITVVDNVTVPLDDYKIGDYVRFQRKTKTFDKKGFYPTFSLKVYKIKGRKGRQYILEDDKAYYPEQLIHAREGEDLSELKRKHKEAQQEQRMKNEAKKEITAKDLEKNVVEGKRERKKKTFGDDFQV